MAVTTDGSDPEYFASVLRFGDSGKSVESMREVRSGDNWPVMAPTTDPSGPVCIDVGIFGVNSDRNFACT